MWNRIRNWANQNPGLLTLIAVILAFIGLFLPSLADRLASISPFLAGILQQYNMVLVWLGGFLLVYALILGFINLRKRLQKIEEKIQFLENRPETLLNESSSSNLSIWSFGGGQWTVDQDGLSVTKSSHGGICKIGASWENYNFIFEFKIINKCAGWIVRAEPDSHYVMVQCNNKQIRPHIYTLKQNQDGTKYLGFQLINEIDHGLSINDWNTIRTEVIGHSIKVWINGTMVWTDPELLKGYKMGTVGFRCSQNEHAIFRNIRVIKKQ